VFWSHANVVIVSSAAQRQGKKSFFMQRNGEKEDTEAKLREYRITFISHTMKVKF